MNEVRRRECLMLVLGLACPSMAAAQSTPVRLGFLGTGSTSLSGWLVDAFRQGLSENGMQEGRDYLLEFAWAEGRYEQFRALAVQLVERQPAVILATTIAAVRAVQQATSTIPIVMTSINDPVGAGLVRSLSNPGGNTTGLASLAEDVTLKFAELLQESIPNAQKVAVLINSANSSNPTMFENLSQAIRTKTLARIDVVRPEQIVEKISSIASGTADVLFVLPDFMLIDNRATICEQALKARIPTITNVPEFGETGALISYGSPRRENYRRSAHFVTKILQGVSPAELPIEQPTVIRMVINLKTANSIGITIPTSLLARADEVIE